MSEGALAFEWVAREPPLPPSGVAASGAVARALARKLLSRDDEALGRLRGVAGRGLLVLLGEALALPWQDGVVYLGRDEQAPSLLLPSTRAPAVPAALLEKALLARTGATGAPVAVLLDPPRLVPTAGARAVDRARLAEWLEGEGGA